MINIDKVVFKHPQAGLGSKVHKLVSECPPLDQNSMYCNLLQTHHFSATSIAAIHQSNLIGFISGYLIPDRPDTLFVWQVAVDSKARGIGLASRMLNELLQRPTCSKVKYLETSITSKNEASWKLFERLASSLKTSLNKSVLFDQVHHLNGQHDTEHLVRIGPFTQSEVIALEPSMKSPSTSS
jgi:L-2,4-diaminobutyric acid acetyltransferase